MTTFNTQSQELNQLLNAIYHPSNNSQALPMVSPVPVQYYTLVQPQPLVVPAVTYYPVVPIVPQPIQIMVPMQAPQTAPIVETPPSQSKSMRKAALERIEEDKPLSPVSSTSSSSFSFSPLSSPSNSPTPILDASAPEFVPQLQLSLLHKQPFVPAHAPRAKLNIYIPKRMTKQLISMIHETFPNTGTLYYYLDISTALQINDAQVQLITLNNQQEIAIINFDLHKKEDQNEILYAVVTRNDQHKVEVDTQKWLWKIEEFLGANEIVNKYGIQHKDLPQSSRFMQKGLFEKFQSQLDEMKSSNNFNLLCDYDWESNTIQQIGSSQKIKRGKKPQPVKATMSKKAWLKACSSSWCKFPAIPIVVYENRTVNAHWIEWVKMIYIESHDCYVGVSFRSVDGHWQIASICLDKGDIQNKHRLLGLKTVSPFVDYDDYVEQFSTRITEVEWR